MQLTKAEYVFLVNAQKRAIAEQDTIMSNALSIVRAAHLYREPNRTDFPELRDRCNTMLDTLTFYEQIQNMKVAQ